jgi:hypothetical protein
MAKETLVKKNIILWPDKSKKIFTKLNQDVASASSFEEAEKMIETKKPVLATMPVIEGNFNVADLAADLDTVKIPTVLTSPITVTAPTNFTIPTTPTPPPTRSYSLMKIVPLAETTETTTAEVTWWMKPLYLYFVWPVCGAVAGVFISMLMNLAYHALFGR